MARPEPNRTRHYRQTRKRFNQIADKAHERQSERDEGCTNKKGVGDEDTSNTNA